MFIFNKNFFLLALLFSASVGASTITDRIKLPSTDDLFADAEASASCIVGTSTSPSNILFQYNSFTSPFIAVNPDDKKNYVIAYNRDALIDTSGTLVTPTIIDNQIAFSKDCGHAWGISNPQPSSCVGGTRGQLVAPLNYPLSFSKNGILYFAGGTRPTDGSLGVTFVSTSKDGGATWLGPVVVPGSQKTSAAVFGDCLDPITCANLNTADCGNNCIANSGLTGSVLADPIHDCTVHVAWNTISKPTLDFGSVWYSRSTDGAKTFSSALQVYDLSTDPTWLSQYSNTNFTAPCFRGQILGATLVSVPSKHKNKQTLLIGFLRIYPKKHTTCDRYIDTIQAPSITFYDHGVIRSCDDGQNWSLSASQVPQYVFAAAHDPRTSGIGGVPLIVSDGSLNTYMAVSPKTNRVYMVWQGGNCALANNCATPADENIAQHYPLIQLSASDDAGETWTTPITVSQTQINCASYPSRENCQSFNPNIIVLENGLVGVIYADFRNNAAAVGSKDPVNADIWLAIFKETKNFNINAGLELVNEVRLTPNSFDASIGFSFPPKAGNSALNGFGSVEGIAAAGCSFLTAWGQTNYSNTTPGTRAGWAPIPQSTFASNSAKADANNRISIQFGRVS